MSDEQCQAIYNGTNRCPRPATYEVTAEDGFAFDLCRLCLEFLLEHNPLTVLHVRTRARSKRARAASSKSRKESH